MNRLHERPTKIIFSSVIRENEKFPLAESDQRNNLGVQYVRLVAHTTPFVMKRNRFVRHLGSAILDFTIFSES